MYSLMKKLFPICRSITGNGNRETLNIIKEIIPINIIEVPTGTKVFDWTVPKEWNIKDAYVLNSKKEKVIDFKTSNLHVLSYSIPTHTTCTLEELKKHLHYLKDLPDHIPYLTSYYKENWGFCISYNDFLNLKEDTYEVVIDSELKNGSLSYGELIVKGLSDKELLFSTYICHPSMCNDVLSGMVVNTFIANYILNLKNTHKYTYRFLFIPETIGSITYLSKNLDYLKEHVIGGYTITCCGDNGNFTYLKTRLENQLTDRVTLHALSNSKINNYKVRDFMTAGSDERQYNYPGIDLNIGSLMRTKYYEFSEYHTSYDNLSFNSEENLCGTLSMYIKCIDIFEFNENFVVNTYCEPHLSKYGLHSDIGGSKILNDSSIILQFLYYCDGRDFLSIAEKLKIPMWELYDLSNILLKNKIIRVESQ
jgi:aminopeptidase-like protein